MKELDLRISRERIDIIRYFRLYLREMPRF